jgi:hypothetical protein
LEKEDEMRGLREENIGLRSDAATLSARQGEARRLGEENKHLCSDNAALLLEKEGEMKRLREENNRLCNDNAALLLDKEGEMRRLGEENSRLCNDNVALLQKADKTGRLMREESSRLHSDIAALTGGIAEATRRVEVKKEFNEVTVDRIQKVRAQQPDLKSSRNIFYRSRAVVHLQTARQVRSCIFEAS